jgi:pilus assembly protein CpaF
VRDIMIQVTGGVGVLWADFGHHPQRLDWQLDAVGVRNLAVSLIAAGGRHIDELNPCADVRLGDGIRVHAVLPPACATGAAISIRLARVVPLSFDDLEAAGFCTPSTAATLRKAVLQRRNLLIVGGTASGKTTALTALLDLVPHHERVVTIEDVAELRLQHPHWVSLEARQANTEGAGELSLDRLLREALRMRPDRVVLGECRGAELLTLLTALNTGHDGGAGTLHANGLSEVPARLEALGLMGGLGVDALARQVYSALHLVVHLERTPGGRHRVAGLGRFMLIDGALEVEVVPCVVP